MATSPADDASMESQGFKGFSEEEIPEKVTILKVLRLKHQALLRSVTQIESELKAANVTAAISRVNLRELSKLKNSHRGVFNQILEQLPLDAENNFKHDESFRKLATVIEVAHESFAIESPPSTPTTSISPVLPSAGQHLSIPMPTFDGSYQQWTTFKAMFMDLMNRSCDSDAVKLYHLNKALVGKASGVISASVIASNSFASAWKLLEERFENPRVIIEHHISGLLKLKPLTRESAIGLRELVETCSTHVYALVYMKHRQCDVLEQCGTEDMGKAKPAMSKVYSSTIQNCKVCKKNATLHK